MYSSYTDPTTGITYTDQYDIFTVGAGYLDVAAALGNTDLAPATSIIFLCSFSFLHLNCL